MNNNQSNCDWGEESAVHTGQGFPFLSIIRDLYDNSIVAYKTGSEQNINLVLNTIKAAKIKEAEYDQGCQDKRSGHCRAATPQWPRLSIYVTTKIATLAEAKILIDDYIYFYNNQRIQTKTKLTPLELRRQYAA